MIRALLSKFWLHIAGGLGLIATLFAARQSGVSAQKRKQAEAQVKNMKNANEVRDEVQAMDDEGVRDDLARWVQRKPDV